MINKNQINYIKIIWNKNIYNILNIITFNLYFIYVISYILIIYFKIKYFLV